MSANPKYLRERIQIFKRVIKEAEKGKPDHLFFKKDVVKSEPGQENLISPGLKILHKHSGILYTVQQVIDNEAILKNPEGEKFLIDASELKDYELA